MAFIEVAVRLKRSFVGVGGLGASSLLKKRFFLGYRVRTYSVSLCVIYVRWIPSESWHGKWCRFAHNEMVRERVKILTWWRRKMRSNFRNGTVTVTTDKRHLSDYFWIAAIGMIVRYIVY